MMTCYTVLRLIERYHFCLPTYAYNIASLTQEAGETAVKSAAQAGAEAEGEGTNQEIPAQAENQNANSSTSSTSNSNHLLVGQNAPATSAKNKNNPVNLKSISSNQIMAGGTRSLDQCLRLHVRISRKASKVPGTTAHLREGDILTLEQLLYGMMLPSGNDSAYALAEFFGKVLKDRKYSQKDGEEDQRASTTSNFHTKTSYSHAPCVKYFLLEMNFYALKLGLTNTNYDSPHGLINKNNVSCASDVARLIRECMIGGPRAKAARKTDDFTAL